ncbi:MAG: exodeoxyribonuclease VII large subunit, partial [Methanobacteriota archaeon]
AFNEEVLARAIAASPVPVVSAVGHETDYTISDFVADLRAPTPSAAAEVLVPDRETLRRRVRLTAEALRQHLLRRALHARERYARFAEASVLARPDRWMATRAQGLDDASLRLSRVMRVLVARWTERTRADETLLASLSPESTLLRGYAIVRRDDGTVLSTAQAARPGEGLRVELSDGIVTTQVTKVDIHGRRTRE